VTAIKLLTTIRSWPGGGRDAELDKSEPELRQELTDGLWAINRRFPKPDDEIGDMRPMKIAYVPRSCNWYREALND
jgi:hypothetical protein